MLTVEGADGGGMVEVRRVCPPDKTGTKRVTF